MHDEITPADVFYKIAANPPEPATTRPVQISVIARRLPPGASHEVRWVDPDAIVMKDGEIDWDATPYESVVIRPRHEWENAKNPD